MAVHPARDTPPSSERSAADEGRLAGEASHAAGNLIHRLYYLTDVLEDGTGADGTSGALRDLKDALGELHVLVTRAMSLLKPVKVRTMEVAAVDVAISIVQRFGLAADLVEHSACVEELRAMPVDVDPTQLDRAMPLLVEWLCGRADADSHHVAVDVELAVDTLASPESENARGLAIKCSAARDCTDARNERDDVYGALAVAVAMRLLATFGCDASVIDHESTRDVIIFVPASSRYLSNRTPR